MQKTESFNTESSKEDAFDVAVDGMGGDAAPEMVVSGLSIAAERHPKIRVLLTGDRACLGPLLDKYPKAASICTIEHTDVAISMDMKPTSALRLRRSSMRLAMESVASGRAGGVVSAGNSGAMLALAKIIIKTLPGISRPAMAAISPTLSGDAVLLDLGANVSCDWQNLVEFSIMGEAFAKAVLGLPKPSIGLLNVGVESLKGDEKLQVAAEILRESSLSEQFHGFVEGHDITQGTTDIVVTDGFTGNVALKTGEGVIRMISLLLKQVFTTNLKSRLGYLLAKPGIDRMRDWLDPRRYNGAVFLGLNGMVVKSHGGADAQGFSSAIDVAMNMEEYGFSDSIRKRLTQVRPFMDIRKS